MLPRRPSLIKHLAATGAIILIMAGASPHAVADEGSAHWAPDRLFVQAGLAEGARSTIVGVNWAPFWSRDLAGGEAEVFWEASFGRWVGDRDTTHPRTQWIGQAGLTPVLRWQPADEESRWFLEAGIGLNVISPTYRRGSKRFSTGFNFGDHIGAGWRFGSHQEHEIAFRLEHFSNCGIKLPNPGENFRQLRYTYAL